jgi:hypothetical protein
MIISGITKIVTPGTPIVLGTTNINNPLAIKALWANTGLVYLGDSTLASGSNGFQLDAGEVIVFEYVGDLESIYLDADVSNEGASWIVLNI